MTRLRRFAVDTPDSPRRVRFSPDGKWMTGVVGAKVRLWNLPVGTWREFDRLEHGDYPLKAIAYSPDGRLIATGGGGGAAGAGAGGPVVQDLASGECLFSLDERPRTPAARSVFALAFSPDGARIADGSFDGMIRTWDAADGRPLKAVRAHDHPGHGRGSTVQGLAFSPRDNLLASGAPQDSVKLWSADQLELLKSLDGGSRGVNTVAFSDDGQFLASAGWDGTARVWSMPTGELAAESSVNAGAVGDLSWEPGSHRLVTVGEDAGVRIWDVRSAGPPEPILSDAKGFSIDWSKQGIAVAGSGHVLLIENLS